MSPTRSSSSTRQRHRRRVIDLRGLLPDEEIAPDTDVLNGIAYDAASERIFVTGKDGANSSKSKSYPNKIPHDVTKNRDIRHELEHRILLLDGGFGTMIQQYGLDEADYRGKEFAASEKLLRGCNDLLNLTRPETIREIHEKYLQAGSDVITSNTFNANSISLADYGLAAEAYRINRVGAAIAREAADAFTARNPQKPRFVGGSMGPTSHTLSMSADVDNPAPGLSLSNSSRRRTTIRPGA